MAKNTGEPYENSRHTSGQPAMLRIAKAMAMAMAGLFTQLLIISRESPKEIRHLIWLCNDWCHQRVPMRVCNRM